MSKRYVDLSTLTEPEFNIISAMAAMGDKDFDTGALRQQWLRATAAREQRENHERVQRYRGSGNPYLNNKNNWSCQRYLNNRPEWKRRQELAHDLRTQGPAYDAPHSVPREAKTRYQAIREAFLDGYLDAAALLREARLFDDACRVFQAEDARRRAERIDTNYWGDEWVAKEVHRLREYAREGYNDRERWLLVINRKRDRQEAREKWLARERHQAATAQQQAKLKEGAATLAAIRKELREARRSQPRELVLAKTSPTS